MICRLCLCDLNVENSVLLFNEFDSDDDPHLLTIIAKYLHLDITWDDEISTTVCNKCSQHLSEFEKYCVFIGEQQIKLSQKLPVVGDENVPKPMQELIKNEPIEDIVTDQTKVPCVTIENNVTEAVRPQCEHKENIVTQEIQVRCGSDDYIVAIELEPNCEQREEIVTSEVRSQCEQEKIVALSEMDLSLNSLPVSQPQNSVICSTISSYSEPQSDLLSEQPQSEQHQLQCEQPQPQPQCEQEKTVMAVMDVDFNSQPLPPENTVICSAISSYSEPSSSKMFHNAYTQYIQKSSTVKRVRPILDATAIKHLQPLQKIYQSYLKGNPLDMNDRITIAKSVIEEACMANRRSKVLKPEDFMRLAEDITEVYPSELTSTFYVPPIRGQKPSGKLWIIYNSKRKSKDFKTDFTKKKGETQQKKKMANWSAERWREYRARIQVYTKNLKELRKKKDE